MRFAGAIHALLIRLCTLAAVSVVCGCVPPDTEPVPDLDTMDGSARVIDGTTPAAMDRYKTLLETLSPADARAALVQELTANPGVASATLSSDGTTIRLVYTNGSTVAIHTNELDLEPIDDQQLAALLDPIAKSGKTWRALPKKLAPQARDLFGSQCPGISKAMNQKVKIVVAASVTNPSMIDVGLRLYQGFVDRGWAEDDVTLLVRSDRLDTSILPDDLLNHTGYGVVIIIARGHICQNQYGRDHFFIQCSGSEGDYAALDDIDPALRPKYAQWTADGDIELTWNWSEDGEKIPEYWLSDILFASELIVDPGTIVHLLSPNGCQLQDEFVDGHLTGSFMCWDGAVRPNHGAATALAMFSTMGDRVEARTDEQALQILQANGLGASVDRDGRPVYARLANIAQDAYLPTWGDVWANSVPEGTTQYHVKIEFPEACADAASELTLDVQEGAYFDYLTPGPIIISFEALDASGKVLGIGATEESSITAGHNGFGLNTCTAAILLSLDLDAYLEFIDNGPNTAAVMHAELTPAESDAPHPEPIDIDTPFGGGEFGYPMFSEDPYELWPGRATLTTRLQTAAGIVLGTSTQVLDLACGLDSVDIDYGWANLVVRKYPFNATKIRVSSITGGNAAWPIQLAPGESRKIYGYDLNQTAIFTAEALDASDKVIGSTEVFATLACGETEVPIDIISYGIILTSSRATLLPDGNDSATITATLKEWLTGDILEPTGDPVAGKSVKFSTTLGTLTGTNPAVTDANGQATIVLTGTQLGEADLHAFVAADVVENYRMLHVLFRREYGIAVAISSGEPLANGQDKVTITATLRKWKDTDGLEPTGDPIAGKLVTFSKDAGSFTGANPVVSDATGRAAIQLSSTTAGTVHVTVAVLADGVQISCGVCFKGEWAYCSTYLTGATYPAGTWPTVYYYIVDAQWAKVEGAALYELEVYTDDPADGGQYVETIQTAGEVTTENPNALRHRLVEGQIGVADLDALHAAVAQVKSQYNHYWARVRVAH